MTKTQYELKMGMLLDDKSVNRRMREDLGKNIQSKVVAYLRKLVKYKFIGEKTKKG